MALRGRSRIGLWMALLTTIAVSAGTVGAAAPAGAASTNTPILVQTTYTAPGIPQGQTLNAPLRASDDTLWSIAGTDLLRFDGAGTFTRFPGYPSGTASSLSNLVSYAGGFAYFAVATDSSRHLMHIGLDGTVDEVAWPANFKRVRAGVASPDGSVWFPVFRSTTSDPSYLVRVAGGVLTSTVVPADVQRFVPTGDGGAYFETNADGVFRLTADGTISTVAGTENSYFFSLWPGAGGSVWLAGYDEVGSIGSDGVLQSLTTVGLSNVRPVTTVQQATTWLVGDDGSQSIALVGTTPSNLVKIPLHVSSATMTVANGRLWVLQHPDPALASSPLFTVRADGAMTPMGNTSDSGNDISTGPDGTVWVAKVSALVAFRPDGTVHRGGRNSWPQSAPQAFTSDGSPWMPNGDGLTTFRDATSNRLAGATRYEAAANIATTAFPTGAPIVYLASGANFPDALSAGPLAAADGGPLLLTTPGSLPQATRDALAALGPQKIVVVGGTSSVSPAVLTELRGLASEVDRIAGADRYVVSRDIVASKQQAGKPLFVATGAGYADAVTAGAAAARAGGQLLLVPGDRPTLPPGYASFIGALAPSSIAVVGGPATVSDGILNQLNGIATATRYGGDDRYAVSAAVVSAFGTPSSRVYVTTGQNFPDALAAAPLAGRSGATLVSIPGTCVPTGTLSAIDRARPSAITILGGTDSVAADASWLTTC